MQLCYYPIFPCYLNVNWVITAISSFYSSSPSVSEILFHSLEFTSTSLREIRLPIGTFFIQILIEKTAYISTTYSVHLLLNFFFIIIQRSHQPLITGCSLSGSFLHQECHSQNESSSVDKPACRDWHGGVEAQ